MAATRHPLKAREKERFPTEWALFDGDECAGERERHQSEAALPEGWAPVSPLEATGRPARQSARLDRQTGDAT